MMPLRADLFVYSTRADSRAPRRRFKGLMKMALYPPLYHRNLVRVLTRIVDGALS